MEGSYTHWRRSTIPNENNVIQRCLFARSLRHPCHPINSRFPCLNSFEFALNFCVNKKRDFMSTCPNLLWISALYLRTLSILKQNFLVLFSPLLSTFFKGRKLSTHLYYTKAFSFPCLKSIADDSFFALLGK